MDPKTRMKILDNACTMCDCEFSKMHSKMTNNYHYPGCIGRRMHSKMNIYSASRISFLISKF
jgi:hypothetical protein